MPNEQLIRRALALPLAERIDLVQALWESIDGLSGPGANAISEQGAIELAKARDAELNSGAASGRPHPQVMDAASRILKGP